MPTITAIPTIDTESRNLEPDCAAHRLSPSARQALAVEALSEVSSVSELSRQHEVSRKFVAHQRDKATQALETHQQQARDSDHWQEQLWQRMASLQAQLADLPNTLISSSDDTSDTKKPSR